MRSLQIALVIVLAIGLIAATGCAVPRPLLEEGRGGVIVEVAAKQDADVPRHAGDVGKDSYGPSTGADLETYDYRRMNGMAVYLTTPDGGTIGAPIAPLPPVTITLTATGFSLAVVAAGSGQMVRITNDTGAEASFFAVDPYTGDEVQLGSAPAGGATEWTAERVGAMALYTTAGDAEALLFVAPSPYAAVVGAGEEAVFAHVPPGTYRVHGWHEVLPAHDIAVNVVAGQYTSVPIIFSVDALAK